MSISRRGLIAAGLALATVSTVGVASTMNAGAAQIEPPPPVTATTEPGTTEPAATEPAATEPATDEAATEPAGTEPAAGSPVAEPPAKSAAVGSAVGRTAPRGRRTPPGKLPWGGKPHRAKIAGTTSLNSERAAATGGETAGEVEQPEPAYEPKGRPAVRGVTRGVKAATGATGVTTTAALTSTTTATTTAAAVDPIVNYFYSSADEVASNDGAYATLTVGRPWLSKRDYHSLAEVAVRSLDGRQTIEVGWTVDRDVNNGSSEPHLFVYHWVDFQESCYNGCGFVQYSGSVKPGDPLPVGTDKKFAIQHFGTAWWIAYDTEWVGYFPDSLWKGTFTKGSLTQWFGEVAASSLLPCTDMGNGLNALTNPDAATFAEANLINGTPGLKPALSVANAFYPNAPDEELPNTFRFGGKGAC